MELIAQPSDLRAQSVRLAVVLMPDGGDLGGFGCRFDLHETPSVSGTASKRRCALMAESPPTRRTQPLASRLRSAVYTAVLDLLSQAASSRIHGARLVRCVQTFR